MMWNPKVRLDGLCRWACPGCERDVLGAGETRTQDEVADPLCCYCRPADDPRLTAEFRAVRLRRTAQGVLWAPA